MDVLHLYSNLLMIIGALYVGMFLYALTKRDNPLVSAFSLLCLASAVYIFGTHFQLNADNVEEVLFGQKLKYFGVPLIPAAWFLFMYRVQFRRDITHLGRVVLFTVPFLTIFLVSTNEYHRLYYAGLHTFESGGFLLTRRVPGPLYPINMAYAYLSILAGLYVFGKAWVQRGRGMNNPFFWLLLGRIIPGILLTLYLLGWTPGFIDLLPLSYLFSAITYAVAIFHYKLFDTKSIFNKEIFAEIKEGLIVVDHNNVLVDYNESAQAVFPWLVQENRGKPIKQFPEGREIVQNPNPQFTMSLSSAGGVRHYEFRRTELVQGSGMVGRVYIFLDVTEKQCMIEELNFLADHDSLTGVFNRRRILAKAEQLLQRTAEAHQAASLLMLDVDDFKMVNDQYGHQVGDEVLRGIAKACRGILREGDLIGRYGGEEFIIVLPGSGSAQAAACGERLRKSIADTPFQYGSETVRVTASIGICSTEMIKEPPITADKLVRLADEALYKAKYGGKNRVHVCSGS
ncbi:MAG TPA: diguanylate cyclase [Firmicutes bacterium]|nr:diguanylate cyclase [Bacillota bacterium]